MGSLHQIGSRRLEYSRSCLEIVVDTGILGLASECSMEFRYYHCHQLVVSSAEVLEMLRLGQVGEFVAVISIVEVKHCA